MYPERVLLDLAIQVDGVPTPSTTHLTTVGVGAFCVVVETSIPEVHGLRLVSSYLGSPGDASASTHHLHIAGAEPLATRRSFMRPPADAAESIRDHMSQLHDRLEEQDVSPHFGCPAVRAPFRLS
jgi:hypothetical protein